VVYTYHIYSITLMHFTKIFNRDLFINKKEEYIHVSVMPKTLWVCVFFRKL